MDIWLNKTRILRKKIKGWSINLESDMKKRKKTLLQEFDILDVFSETSQLDPNDKIRLEEIKKELEDIWKKEETALCQRSRDRRRIKDGDKNNRYFHALANHRHRKNHLFELNGDDGPVHSTKEMLVIATSFYKNLFSYEHNHNICLGPSFWKDHEKVTSEENDILQKNFSEEEIKRPFSVPMPMGLQVLMAFPLCFINPFGS
ncbi:hypothetical protein ZWY2020_005414 [Hordeum vulgare]|nr:hypothetical protein ZWY2020_005414 [Hordeum vulgare]